MGISDFFKNTPTTIEESQELLRNFLISIGYEENKNFRQGTKEEGIDNWFIVAGPQTGEPLYLICQAYTNDDNSAYITLKIRAEAINMPKKDLLGFYRKLLELNSEHPYCSVGLEGKVVTAILSRPMEGIDKDEFYYCINSVDSISNYLRTTIASEFNASLVEG